MYSRSNLVVVQLWSVLVSQDYHDKGPQTTWLTNSRSLSSHSSGGWQYEIKVSAEHAPSEGSRKESLFLVICDNPWVVAAPHQSLPHHHLGEGQGAPDGNPSEHGDPSFSPRAAGGGVAAFWTRLSSWRKGRKVPSQDTVSP